MPRRNTHRKVKRFNRVTRAGKRSLSAYHEASHAVLFELFGFRVHAINFVRQGESLARTECIKPFDENEFEELLDRGEEEDALWLAQTWILALLAGRVGESICLDRGFDAARFERDTFWEHGKPVPREKLPPGYLEHTDRDKAHLMSRGMLRVRRGIARNASKHLRESWHETERVLRDAWPSVIRVGEALLLSKASQLSRSTLRRLIYTAAFVRLCAQWNSPETSVFGLTPDDPRMPSAVNIADGTILEPAIRDGLATNEEPE